MVAVESAFEPGTVIAGKYVVERVLGRGGMGIVLAARHMELDERFALKFLLPEGAAQADIVARFVREGRAAVKIRSEHVARIFDVGKLEHGLPYMVMEYLEGHDLSALVERGPLPVELAADYLLQACEAIAEAHALGMVHRDLKPANLFLVHRADGSPCVKVLDFGISKVAVGATTDGSMTRTSALMGSPLYMSPEQMTSARDVDARSDIWALGVILYELVSGRTPFAADTLPQVCGLIIQSEPAPVSSFVRVPQGLEAVIARCLAKRASDRYASVAELAAALAPLASYAGKHSAERIARVLKSPARAMQASQPSLSENAATPLQVDTFPRVDTSPNSAAAVSTPLEQGANIGGAHTLGSWGKTGSQQHSKSRFGVVMIAVGSVAVLAVGGLSLALMQKRANDQATLASANKDLTTSESAKASPPEPLKTSSAAQPPSSAEPVAAPAVDPGTVGVAKGDAGAPNDALSAAAPPAQKPPQKSRTRPSSGRTPRQGGGDLFEDRK